MRTILLVSLLASASTAADYVVTADGPRKIEEVTTINGHRFFRIEGSIDDPDDPDDPPTTIADKVAAIATGVGEQDARGAFAAVYRLGSRDVAGGATWATAMNNIKALRTAIISTSSTKKAEWNAAFGKIDALVEAAPHTAVTLADVDRGLSRGAAAQPAINWLKIITCILGGIGEPAVEPSKPATTKPIVIGAIPYLEKHQPHTQAVIERSVVAGATVSAVPPPFRSIVTKRTRFGQAAKHARPVGSRLHD